MDITPILKDCVFGEAYCRSLFDFISSRTIKNGLEVGLDSGSSALMFLAAQPNATLVSVDVRALPDAQALIAKWYFSSRHTSITGKSADHLKVMIDGSAGFDYIYVDGDHLYDGVRADLELCASLLNPGGVMVVDDCVPNHGLFGVYEAVEDFLLAHSGWTKTMLPGNPNLACVLTRTA